MFKRHAFNVRTFKTIYFHSDKSRCCENRSPDRPRAGTISHILQMTDFFLIMSKYKIRFHAGEEMRGWYIIGLVNMGHETRRRRTGDRPIFCHSACPEFIEGSAARNPCVIEWTKYLYFAFMDTWSMSLIMDPSRSLSCDRRSCRRD